MSQLWKFIREHLFEHLTMISLAMINIPVLYKWLLQDGYGNIYAAIASVALDLGIYYVATEEQQSIYSRIALVLSTLLLVCIQLYQFGLLTGSLHSGYTLVATFVLLHVQNKSIKCTDNVHLHMASNVDTLESTCVDNPESTCVDNLESTCSSECNDDHVCSVCGKVFISKKGLSIHMRKAHKMY